jgi:hypothetical protein
MSPAVSRTRASRRVSASQSYKQAEEYSQHGCGKKRREEGGSTKARERIELGMSKKAAMSILEESKSRLQRRGGQVIYVDHLFFLLVAPLGLLSRAYVFSCPWRVMQMSSLQVRLSPW